MNFPFGQEENKKKKRELGYQRKDNFVSMKSVKFMDGFAWQVSQGIIPFGNARPFLSPGQVLDNNVSCSNVTNYPAIIAQHST